MAQFAFQIPTIYPLRPLEGERPRPFFVHERRDAALASPIDGLPLDTQPLTEPRSSPSITFSWLLSLSPPQNARERKWQFAIRQLDCACRAKGVNVRGCLRTWRLFRVGRCTFYVRSGHVKVDIRCTVHGALEWKGNWGRIWLTKSRFVQN